LTVLGEKVGRLQRKKRNKKLKHRDHYRP